LNEWLTLCEEILTKFKTDNNIPYDYIRYNGDATQLPDTYITYFMVDDLGKSWSDNKEKLRSIRIQVSLYYRKKEITLTIPDKIEAAFIAANFMRIGAGTIPYQSDTGHYGWRCDFRYFERR